MTDRHTPGIGDVVTATPTLLILSDMSALVKQSVVISSVARDFSTSPAGDLQKGLLMSRIDASGKWSHFDNSGSPAAYPTTCHGILLDNRSVINPSGGVQDTHGTVALYHGVYRYSVAHDYLQSPAVKLQGVTDLKPGGEGGASLIPDLTQHKSV